MLVYIDKFYSSNALYKGSGTSVKMRVKKSKTGKINLVVTLNMYVLSINEVSYSKFVFKFNLFIVVIVIFW
jgi:hypothetical protein